jgi:hypothetical protein
MNFDNIQNIGANFMNNINEQDLNQIKDTLVGLLKSYKIENVQDVFNTISSFPGISELIANNPLVSSGFNTSMISEGMLSDAKTSSNLMLNQDLNTNPNARNGTGTGTGTGQLGSLLDQIVNDRQTQDIIHMFENKFFTNDNKNEKKENK